jgi:DNA-3-methyladenine glycosylase II
MATEDFQTIDEVHALAAANHLSQQDAILAPIIDRVGLCTLRPHKNYYRELVESIIGQQLSVKAAAAIEARFINMFDGTFPTPEQILSKTVEQLREIGFSRPKANYVQDLAVKVVAGTVKFNHFDSLPNKEIIKELVSINGIGEWTAHMFLMFCMGRMDVLPVGDLGIRNSIRSLYNLADVPTPEQIIEIAESNHWHPYESIASWYIWKSLDNEPVQNLRELATGQ